MIIIAPSLYHYFCTFLVLILSRRVSEDEKMESRVQSSSEKESEDAIEWFTLREEEAASVLDCE